MPTSPSAIGDGLPETLPEWIAADGLTHLKIKLNGDDLAWDVDRVVAIERVAAEAQAAPRLHGVVLFGRLQREVRQRRVRARFPGPASASGRRRRWRGSQYIEQPTHRDLRANPENRMHARGADQAGGDRRIAGRPGEPAAEPRAGLLGRGPEGLQGAQRSPADGRRPRRSTACSSACRT